LVEKGRERDIFQMYTFKFNLLLKLIMWLSHPENDTPSQNQPRENTTTLFKGRIIEIIEKNIDGRTFEIARRSPGVRLIIREGNKILLTREYRHEHNTYDYRLPGGKVFDTLEEFNEKIQNNENINTYAEAAAKNECKQETGLRVKSIQPLTISKAWATVEWDLHYFLINDFAKNEKGQELEEGENIITEWKTLEEAKNLCLDGSVKEDRSVGILLKYLLNQ
jgi:ADP-ribose pyrophosphatase